MAKRILVRNHGPDKETIIRSFASAFKEAKEINSNVIHLIVPSKAAFPGTVPSDFLGDEASKQLLKGETVLIKDGISLKLESPETVKHSSSVRIALAVYLDAKALRVVDGLSNVGSIVFLPWISEEGEGWQASWNAMILGEKYSENDLALHPDLEKELNSLTACINLSTGFGHPSDKKTAQQMFVRLGEAGIPFDPKKLRSWALRNGWRPDFAENLKVLAEKYTSQ
jgi:hypothetical protein